MCTQLAHTGSACVHAAPSCHHTLLFSTHLSRSSCNYQPTAYPMTDCNCSTPSAKHNSSAEPLHL